MTVPLNPAANLAVCSVNESDLTGAVTGVYRHKTQAKAKYVTILYTNLSKNNIIITPGEIITHGSMCTVEKKDKSLINAVKTENKNKMVTDQLCYVRK